MRLPRKLQTLTILVVLALPLGSHAAENSPSKHFEDQNWDKALTAWEAQLKKEPANPKLLFNTGITYAKLGQLGNARIALLEARRRGDDLSRIYEALSKLDKQIKSQYSRGSYYKDIKPRHSFKRSIVESYDAFAPSVWLFMTGLGLWLVFLISLVARIRGWSTTTPAIAAGVIVTLFSLPGYLVSKSEPETQTCATTEDITPRSGPSEHASEVGARKLGDGHLVEKDSQQNEWIRIAYGEERSMGWIRTESLVCEMP